MQVEVGWSVAPRLLPNEARMCSAAPDGGAPYQRVAMRDSRYCVGDKPVSARNWRLKALWSV